MIASGGIRCPLYLRGEGLLTVIAQWPISEGSLEINLEVVKYN